jgi:hypothetical protein
MDERPAMIGQQVSQTYHNIAMKQSVVLSRLHEIVSVPSAASYVWKAHQHRRPI